ncbi:TPA: MFS transporter [Pseudomonas aeruginosa]
MSQNSDAHAEEVAASTIYLAIYFISFLMLWAAALPPTFVTLALKISSISPDEQANVLGLVLAIGAFVAMVCGPVIGKLSDATTLSLGRRRPWILGGALLAPCAAVWCGSAESVLSLLLAYSVLQLGLNSVTAGLSAVIIDRIPVKQRHVASALLAVSIPCGMVLGAGLVELTAGNFILMFAVPSFLMMIFAILFCCVHSEARLLPGAQSRNSSKQLQLTGYFSTVSAGFKQILVARFLMGGALSVLTTYQSLFLISKLGYHADQVPFLVTYISAAFAVSCVMAGVYATVSKRVGGQQEKYSIAASFLACVAFVGLGFAGSFAAMLVLVVVSGFAWGMYSAVENYLVALLVKSDSHAATDFGVYRSFAILPQIFIPISGALALAVPGADLAALFVLAGGLALGSALIMRKISFSH